MITNSAKFEKKLITPSITTLQSSIGYAMQFHKLEQSSRTEVVELHPVLCNAVRCKWLPSSPCYTTLCDPCSNLCCNGIPTIYIKNSQQKFLAYSCRLRQVVVRANGTFIAYVVSDLDRILEIELIKIKRRFSGCRSLMIQPPVIYIKLWHCCGFAITYEEGIIPWNGLDSIIRTLRTNQDSTCVPNKERCLCLPSCFYTKIHLINK